MLPEGRLVHIPGSLCLQLDVMTFGDGYAGSPGQVTCPECTSTYSLHDGPDYEQGI